MKQNGFKEDQLCPKCHRTIKLAGKDIECTLCEQTICEGCAVYAQCDKNLGKSPFCWGVCVRTGPNKLMAKTQSQASSSGVQYADTLQPKKLAKDMAEVDVATVSEVKSVEEDQVETQALIDMSDEDKPDEPEEGTEQKDETGNVSEEKEGPTEPSQATGISQEESMDVLSATI